MGKPRLGPWSMKFDRELIVLAKTKKLGAIADQMQRIAGRYIKARGEAGAHYQEAEGWVTVWNRIAVTSPWFAFVGQPRWTLSRSSVAFCRSIKMDNSFLKEQADRCRSLAETADPFIKKRLLDLATHYDKRLNLPSRASRTIAIPTSLLEARLQENRS